MATLVRGSALPEPLQRALIEANRGTFVGLTASQWLDVHGFYIKANGELDGRHQQGWHMPHPRPSPMKGPVLELQQ